MEAMAACNRRNNLFIWIMRIKSSATSLQKFDISLQYRNIFVRASFVYSEDGKTVTLGATGNDYSEFLQCLTGKSWLTVVQALITLALYFCLQIETVEPHRSDPKVIWFLHFLHRSYPICVLIASPVWIHSESFLCKWLGLNPQ